MFGNDWEYLVRGTSLKTIPTKILKQATVLEEISIDQNTAGMIPRSIYNIFNIVDEANTEF